MHRDLFELGPEKVQLLDRCGSVEAAGLTWTMHTDAPVSPLGALRKDPRAVEPTAISDIQVSQTWMDGQQAFGT